MCLTFGDIYNRVRMWIIPNVVAAKNLITDVMELGTAKSILSTTAKNAITRKNSYAHFYNLSILCRC